MFSNIFVSLPAPRTNTENVLSTRHFITSYYNNNLNKYVTCLHIEYDAL